MSEGKRTSEDEWVRLASTESTVDTEDAFRRLFEAGIHFRIAPAESERYRKTHAAPIRILVQQRDFDRAVTTLWGDPVEPAPDQ
jgi:hypothetical protein